MLARRLASTLVVGRAALAAPADAHARRAGGVHVARGAERQRLAARAVARVAVTGRLPAVVATRDEDGDHEGEGGDTLRRHGGARYLLLLKVKMIFIGDQAH